jgi:hypothetical protein
MGSFPPFWTVLACGMQTEVAILKPKFRGGGIRCSITDGIGGKKEKASVSRWGIHQREMLSFSGLLL